MPKKIKKHFPSKINNLEHYRRNITEIQTTRRVSGNEENIETLPYSLLKDIALPAEPERISTINAIKVEPRLPKHTIGITEKLIILSLLINMYSSSTTAANPLKNENNNALKKSDINTLTKKERMEQGAKIAEEYNMYSQQKSGLDRIIQHGKNIDLIEAVKSSDKNRAQAAIQSGANVDWLDEHNQSCLSIALMSNDLKMVKFLFEHHANPNLFVKENSLNDEYIPAICYLVLSDDRKTILKHFLLNNADPNRVTKKEQQSSLMMAARINNFDAVQLLLTYGADLEKKNIYGEDALAIAKKTKHVVVTYYLENFLHIQSVAEDPTQLDKIELINKIDQETLLGMFFITVSNVKYLNMARWLLDNKVTPNVVDADGSSALHYAAAVQNNSTAIIRFLISYGAELNKQQNHGFRPIDFAVQFKCEGAVLELLFHGAACDRNKSISTTSKIEDILQACRSLRELHFQENVADAFNILDKLPKNTRECLFFNLEKKYFKARSSGEFHKGISELKQIQLNFPNNTVISSMIEDLKIKILQRQQTQKEQEEKIQSSLYYQELLDKGIKILMTTFVMVGISLSVFFKMTKMKQLQNSDVDTILNDFKYDISFKKNIVTLYFKNGIFHYKTDDNNEVKISYTAVELKNAVKECLSKYLTVIDEKSDNDRLDFSCQYKIYIPNKTAANILIKKYLYTKHQYTAMYAARYQQIKALQRDKLTKLNAEENFLLNTRKALESEYEGYPENINDIPICPKTRTIYVKYISIRTAMDHQKNLLNKLINKIHEISSKALYETLNKELNELANKMQNDEINLDIVEQKYDNIMNHEDYSNFLSQIDDIFKKIKNFKENYRAQIDSAISSYIDAREVFNNSPRKNKSQTHGKTKVDKESKTIDNGPESNSVDTTYSSDKNNEYDETSETKKPAIEKNQQLLTQPNNNNNNNNNNKCQDNRDTSSGYFYKKIKDNNVPKSKLNEEDSVKLQSIKNCCEKLAKKVEHLFYNIERIYGVKRDIWEIIFDIIQVAEAMLKFSKTDNNPIPSEPIENYRNTVRHATEYFENPNAFLIDSFKHTVKEFSTEIIRLIYCLETNQKNISNENIDKINHNLRTVLAQIKRASRGKESEDENEDLAIIKSKLIYLYEMRTNFKVLDSVNDPLYIDSMKYLLGLLGDAVRRLRNKHRGEWQEFKSQNNNNLKSILASDDFDYFCQCNKTTNLPLLSLLLTKLSDKPQLQLDVLKCLNPQQTLQLFIEIYRAVGHGHADVIEKINTGFLLLLLDFMQNKLLAAVETFDSFVIEMSKDMGSSFRM